MYSGTSTSLTLKIEAKWPTEISLLVYQSTQRHNTEDSNANNSLLIKITLLYTYSPRANMVVSESTNYVNYELYNAW
jgi:hypothetical protein